LLIQPPPSLTLGYADLSHSIGGKRCTEILVNPRIKSASFA
jgi:hypothetical protein